LPADDKEVSVPEHRAADDTPIPGTRRVRLFGLKGSSEAYLVRDFLARSVVEFDWLELHTDEDSIRALGTPLAESRLPVVEMPDGARLFAPSVRDVASRLGWVSQPRLTEYDLSIYGAGPAGLSAAVYAGSEGLRTVLIEREAVGGQAGTSSFIENYMGFPDGISGSSLAERARQQAVRFGVELLMMREGIKAEFQNGRICVDLADGGKLVAHANICATGVEYRRLSLPNEDHFLNRGLFYGAGASEAPLCSGQHVFVVGGGNSAGQAAMNFARHAKKVTMVIRGDSLAASLSHYLIERVRETASIEVLYHAEVSALEGDESLRRIQLTNAKTGTAAWVDSEWLFVCIGGAPNTDWASETAIIRDPSGYLVTGSDLFSEGRPPACWTLERQPFFLETSVPGSFAAGDVRHNSVKRVASAVGEGAMAVTFVHRYLEQLRSQQ